MPCSPAQLAANRMNARKSCGPGPEGKLKSRANALTHGRAARVVVPRAEEAEVARLETDLAGAMKPTGPLGRILVRRVAVLAARLDRCARHEVAAADRRVRRAVENFPADRAAEVEALASSLPQDPTRSALGLARTAEGLTWLIGAWVALRRHLLRPDLMGWGLPQAHRIDHLLGRRPGQYPPTSFEPLNRAMQGDFTALPEGEDEDLDLSDLKDLARGRIATLIDAEIARLEQARAELDDAIESRDRAEAAELALFDPSKEAALARKYESAAGRELFRTLREFRQVEAEAAEPEAVEELPAELASFVPPPKPAPESPPEPAGSIPTGAADALPVVEARPTQADPVRNAAPRRDSCPPIPLPISA